MAASAVTPTVIPERNTLLKYCGCGWVIVTVYAASYPVGEGDTFATDTLTPLWPWVKP